MLDLVLYFLCAIATETQTGSGLNEREAQGLGQSLRLAESEPDVVQRALLKADVYFEAGDFPGVLAAARDGLAYAPEHLTLLWRAATAELWLQDGERAGLYLARLRRALETGRLGLGDQERWLASIVTLEANAAELVEHTKAADKAIGRARVVVAAIGAILVAGLLRASKASES